MTAQPAGPPTAGQHTPGAAPGVWPALGLIVLYLVAQVAVAAGLAWLVHRLQRAGGSGLATTPAQAAALTLIAVVVAASLAAWLAYRRWPRWWRVAAPPGFGCARVPSGYAWLVAAVVVGVVLPLAGGILTERLAGNHDVVQDIAQLARRVSVPFRIALAVVAVSLAPFIEELLFRGVLLSALIPRFRVVPAVIAVAAGFAAIHLPGLDWQWFALPELLLLGIALAWLRLHFHSLWPAVLAHGANNAVALAALFAAPHGGG